MTRHNKSYEDRLSREIENFSDREVVHDLPAIADYWAATYLLPVAQEFGYSCVNDFYLDYATRISVCGRLELVSIGAGNCDAEIALARSLRDAGKHPFFLQCLDLNPAMLERGKALADQNNLSNVMGFTCMDIKDWQPESTLDIIIANQSLHHFQELELLFGKITEFLDPQGYFLTHDMMGRNGHQRWPEALEIVQSLWRDMPERYKFNHQWQLLDKDFVNRDCSLNSFEGIRAQNILPLLVKHFSFDFFLAYANIIDVFIDRGYGPNFDPGKPEDREFIDRVQAMDQEAIESGNITPTHITAAMTLKERKVGNRYYKHLTPEFCLRRAD